MNRVTTRPNASRDELVLQMTAVNRTLIGRTVRPHAVTNRWFEPGRIVQVFRSMADGNAIKGAVLGTHVVLVLTGTDTDEGRTKVALSVDDLVVITPEARR